MDNSPAYPQPDGPVSFDDTSVAFACKSNRDLLLSQFIFELTRNPLLVKFLSQAAKFSLDIGLPVKPIIKATVFKQFCGGETRAEYEQVIDTLARAGIGAILDFAVEGNQEEAGFDNTCKELLHTIAQAGTNPNIPSACMKMTGIAPFELLEKMTAGQQLSGRQQQSLEKVNRRLASICDAAARVQKPIYIDAEEGWIQGAIDHLCEEKMVEYNRERAVVFTTLQLYRRDRLDYLRRLIAQARSGRYQPGIKIVRGAYLEKERERARRMGYPSPVHATKNDTDNDFNAAIKLLIDHIDVVEICVGTHNAASCNLMAHYMAERKIPNNHPHIYFSQLYGMSDNISFNLARAGYNVSKYLPYGPVESTLPYLARRAEENTAIAGQMSKELEIIIKERNRRKASAALPAQS